MTKIPSSPIVTMQVFGGTFSGGTAKDYLAIICEVFKRMDERDKLKTK